ncbi:MAG: CBS domain-containing protein [Bdellovibrionales bacterium]|nr:CBS domain-containing protein [Bdellovibrionales bacterium]
MSAAHNISHDLHLEQIMVTKVHRITGVMKLREVAELFLSQGISGAPVVDNSGHVISIIGEGAILRLAATEGLEATISSCLPKMTKQNELITLQKHDTFKEAYRLFLKHNIHRIPIVDSNGALQGLLSRNTVLQMFVEAFHGRPIAQRGGR